MSNQPSTKDDRPPRAGIRRGPGPGNPGKIEKANDIRQAFLRLLNYLKPFKVTLVLVFVFVIL
ncbi:MAG: hypothetical protein ACK2UP_04510, partial [Candidatus Promineifilaceae bacterium]